MHNQNTGGVTPARKTAVQVDLRRISWSHWFEVKQLLGPSRLLHSTDMAALHWSSVAALALLLTFTEPSEAQTGKTQL